MTRTLHGNGKVTTHHAHCVTTPEPRLTQHQLAAQVLPSALASLQARGRLGALKMLQEVALERSRTSPLRSPRCKSVQRNNERVEHSVVCEPPHPRLQI